MIEMVFMSPNNGQLVVGIPLFTRHEYKEGRSETYEVSIILEDSEPMVYAMDCGPEFESLQFLNAKWVHENMIWMGEL